MYYELLFPDKTIGICSICTHMTHHHYCLDLDKIILQKTLPKYTIEDVKIQHLYKLESYTISFPFPRLIIN